MDTSLLVGHKVVASINGRSNVVDRLPILPSLLFVRNLAASCDDSHDESVEVKILEGRKLWIVRYKPREKLFSDHYVFVSRA